MKISDEKRKKIIADYQKLKSYKACADKNKVSVYMVKKFVVENNERKETEKCANDISKYMQLKKKDAFNFIDKCLKVMIDDNTLDKASVNQLASALGVVIEKFTKNEISAEEGQINEILRAVQIIE